MRKATAMRIGTISNLGASRTSSTFSTGVLAYYFDAASFSSIPPINIQMSHGLVCV